MFTNTNQTPDRSLGKAWLVETRERSFGQHCTNISYSGQLYSVQQIFCQQTKLLLPSIISATIFSFAILFSSVNCLPLRNKKSISVTLRTSRKLDGKSVCSTSATCFSYFRTTQNCALGKNLQLSMWFTACSLLLTAFGKFGSFVFQWDFSFFGRQSQEINSIMLRFKN